MIATPQFTTDWFSHNVPHLQRILGGYRDHPVSFLEIGAFEGRSTLWFCENILTHPDSTITVVDTFAGSPEHVELGILPGELQRTFRANLRDHINQVRVLVGSSQTILPKMYGEFECCYVDGSHEQRDVLTDAVNAFRLCRTGGYVVFDDYQFRSGSMALQPAIGINAFMSVYAGDFDIVHSDYQLILRKKR